jgi:nitrogen fixation/metabolism regulation signal transduction histidine kinase
MAKRVVIFILLFVVAYVLSLFITGWFLSSGYGQAVNKFTAFGVTFVSVVLLILSVYILFKSISSFVKKEIGSRIRMRLLVMFLLISITSTLILSIVFVVVFNSLRLSFYASPDEKFYSLPKESLKVLSGYYVDTFEELDKAIRSGSYKNGIKNALISLDLEYKDEVISSIAEHLRYSGVNEGRSIVKVGDSEFLFSFKREGNSYLVAYTKIDERITYLKESLSEILRVFSKIEFLFESFFSNYIVYFILLINIPSLFLSLLFAYLSSEYVSASISNLARGMSEVSKGNLNVSVSDNFAFGEIKDLIRSFNDMVVKLREYQYRLMKMERIELWREIARKFAHEIKNPLTPIKLTLQRLMLLSDSPKLKENLIPSLKVILEEVDRIDSLVSQLSNFAKISMPVKTKFEVLDLVLSVKELFSGHNVEFNIQVDGSLKVNADYDQMKQCLINLVKNGIEAQRESPRIDIKAFRRGDFVVISVKDYGEGIPEDVKKEIFKPYTTTKRSGSGLGLSIVETIVMNHGGKVYFESELGKGSEFFIELPVE